MNTIEKTKKLREVLKVAEKSQKRGDYSKANKFHKQALELAEKLKDNFSIVSILYNIGLNTSELTNIEESSTFFNKALEISEGIENKKTHADLLNNIASILATKNKLEKALQLWNESLKIKELINDNWGIANTLLNLAIVEANNGNKDKEKELNLRAIKILIELKSWEDVIPTLVKMYNQEDISTINFLAQALFLSLYVPTNPKTVFYSLIEILKKIGFDNKISPTLVSTAIVSVNLNSQGNNNREIQNQVMEALIACALANNIEEKDISLWVIKNGLNDSAKLLKKLDIALAQIIPTESWLFDKTFFAK